MKERVYYIIGMGFTSFATMFLGLWLLIPFANLFMLREVIYQETGIKADYWKRPLGQGLYGKWRTKANRKVRN